MNIMMIGLNNTMVWDISARRNKLPTPWTAVIGIVAYYEGKLLLGKVTVTFTDNNQH